MATNQWYRRKQWSAEIRADFEGRLARSRGQRTEYLRAQALTLLETGEPQNALPAIELAGRYVELEPTGIFAAQMHAAIARAQVILGNTDQALVAYRKAVGCEHRQPNVRGCHYIDFAWFVATNGISEIYSELLVVIDENKKDEDLIFPANQYRFFGALAFMAADGGDEDFAKRMATNALVAAATEQGPFKSYPVLGTLKGKSDDCHHARLKQLAR